MTGLHLGVPVVRGLQICIQDVVDLVRRSVVSSEMAEEKKQTTKIIGIVIALVIFFYLLLGFAPYFFAGVEGELTVNELGDSFGMANAFFSAAALAGVILTLYFQMTELKLQREEMIEKQRVQLLPILLKDLKEQSAQNPSDPGAQSAKDFSELFIRNEVETYIASNHRITLNDSFRLFLDRLDGIIGRFNNIIEYHDEEKISAKEVQSNLELEVKHIAMLRSFVGRFLVIERFTKTEHRLLRFFYNALTILAIRIHSGEIAERLVEYHAAMIQVYITHLEFGCDSGQFADAVEKLYKFFSNGYSNANDSKPD